MKSVLNILVVEDSEDLRQVLSMGLSTLFGHQVTEASDGESAAQAFLSESFDIILMDFRLPKVSGPELVLQIRQSALNGDTPILFYTGAINEARNVCQHLARVDFLAKPHGLNLIHDKMLKMVN